jgi:hypothetical protein
MDPYLETCWGDVHHRLIQYSCDAIQPGLPNDLIARVEERVFLEADPEQRKYIIPDAHLSQLHEESPWSSSGGTAVAEPLVFEVRHEPTTEGYIEIRRRDGGKVITVIEFLRPSNKFGGSGQQTYLDKQQHILQSDASLVEIDLVRSGDRVLALPNYYIPQEHAADFLACISPGWLRSRRELYAMPLRQRLPGLPIPLRQQEPRITLDLQALIDHAYAAGRYDRIDYRRPLDPPLPTEHTRWADELLKAAIQG